MSLDQYTKGVQAWFSDPSEGWISAELVDKQVSDDAVKLVFKDVNGKEHVYESKLSDVKESPTGHTFDATVLPPLRNPPMLEKTEDLINLSYLNEPSVLHAIRTRYQFQQIYTYSGIVLVAVNPFSQVPLYASDYVQMYAGKRKGELDPHLFAIAEEAYRCMIREEKNQTIIVSGESGAGKTVSAKYIMRYFATVDDPQNPGKRKVSKSSTHAGMSEVEQQILATNPIMEAFGNAKTTRNDNSSRFGKYIEILFDKTYTIIGARIRTYLLERSRLVYQAETERNYHIFYQLLAGAPASDRGSLGLDKVSAFKYLSGGGAAYETIPGVDDAEEFRATQKALSTVGITSEQQWQIFSILAALLHLGNITITQSRTDAMLDDEDAALVQACKLLGLASVSDFKKWLIKKQLVTRSEKIVTALNQQQATVVRDSVAKYIYSSLFDWLVAVVNESLAPQGVDERVKSFIGVLDIYGFEHFKTNSFEQFCINYANEKLQQEFNAHVFKLEQEEYVSEKINWTFIDFSDNQPCIDLIEGKLGILSLLDEESRLPSGSDATFCQKLYQHVSRPEYATAFKKPRFGANAFTVHHYALDVSYDAEGFLEKNKDTVPDEQLVVLQATTNPFLKEILDKSRALATAQAGGPPPATAPDAATPASKRSSVMMGGPKKGSSAVARKPTLGSIFKSSLITLMATIDSTNAHYIRCIKPNEAKVSWSFEPQMVLGQLRACGVLETIRISCAGYPTRWTFEEFAERYYMLTRSDNWGPDLPKLCTQILEATIVDKEKYQIGLTKIFFRAGMLAYLERLRTDRLNYFVTLMQKNLLRNIQQRKYQNLRRATIGVQATWRRVLAQRRAEEARRQAAAILLQRVLKGHVQRTKFLNTRKSAITIQSALRGYQARQLVKSQKQELAATKIQSFWRGCRVRSEYRRDRKRVVLIQATMRRRLARKELLHLKQEAKSASHFKEVSYKLENKVVELTQTLQKRTAENKDLQSQLRAMEEQLQSWMGKFGDAESKAQQYKERAAVPSVALPEFEALSTEKANLDSKLAESLQKIQAQEAQIAKLEEEFARRTAELEERSKSAAVQPASQAEDLSTVASLKAELATLREQLGRAIAPSASAANLRSDPSFNPTTGRLFENTPNGTPLARDAAALNGSAKRRANRISDSAVYVDGQNGVEEAGEHAYDPRSVSMYQQGTASTFKAPGSTAYIAEDVDPAEEIMNLLENDDALDEDVLLGLIKQLKLPNASISNPPFQKEVLFPAHLISLVTNEMWKYGLMQESERFLANVMQTIQQHVMSFQGEDAIQPGIFWLSNVHEIYSFVCIAESDILQGIAPGVDGAGREFDWDDYERLVNIVKHDLDSLEYNIYHTWIQETKKKLSKMIVPALIESQSLPGFVANDGAGRLFNRLLQNNQPPAFSMDELLNILNKVWKSLKAYFVEPGVIAQVITELFKLMGVTAFNDLVMRRNFCSWKRAMQIQYNITRLEEWCKSHGLPEATLQLEHLTQAIKLLQLKKATVQDIEIVQDVCWMLTPSQIHRLIANYYAADYEAPIAPEILREVSSKIVPGDKTDHLLLPPDDAEVGPYDVPLPRTIAGLETFMPSYCNVPSLRRLTQLCVG